MAAEKNRPVFKRAQAVSLPSIALEVGKTRYFRFDAAIVKGTRGAAEHEAAVGPESGRIVNTSQRKVKEPPFLAVVSDAETGEKGMLIINSVLYSTLKQMYPNDAYVGRVFEVTKREKEKGKDYFTFDVYECE